MENFHGFKQQLRWKDDRRLGFWGNGDRVLRSGFREEWSLLSNHGFHGLASACVGGFDLKVVF